DSLRLGREVAQELRIDSVLEDITPILAGAGCYRRRDEHIRSVFPEYGPGYRNKIVLKKLPQSAYNVFHLVIRSPEGQEKHARLPLEAYLGIVAATNMK